MDKDKAIALAQYERQEGVRTRLKDLPQETMDEFARNNMMVYNWAMPVNECNTFIKQFEEISHKDKSQVETFKTGNKEFTEIDLDTSSNPNFWIETKTKFMQMMEVYVDRFKKNLNIRDKDFPPVIDRENIRIKKYLPNDKDEFNIHVDVLRSKGPSSKRFLVFILYLNDVEVGGETHLIKPDILIAPRAGRLLMFPPFWTHPHAGLKPVSGPKYVMMSYLHLGDTLDGDKK